MGKLSEASTNMDAGQTEFTRKLHERRNHDRLTRSESPTPNTDPFSVPASPPLTEEQLRYEIQGIYAGLVMVEKKCIEIESDKQHDLAGLPGRDRFQTHSRPDLQMNLSMTHPQPKTYEHPDIILAFRMQRLKEQIQKHRLKHSRLSPDDGDTRVFEIPCQLAEHRANALGDTGAKTNFLREGFAIQLGLTVTRSSSCLVTVGSGKQVATVGTTTVPFRFRKEQNVYNLKFHILPDCLHDVIIGKQFLKLTETFSNLTNYARRVKERVIKGISQFRFLYLGASTSMIFGTVNGHSHMALADTGSKILAMDEAYARAIGVKIETGDHHRRRVIFADNSVAETVGMAYDVEWRFGHDDCSILTHQLDFHILRDSPANIILSDTFLFDNEVFSKYQDFLIDDNEESEDEETETYFFAIDIDKGQDNLHANQHSYTLADLQHLEVVRRGEEADRISTLSGTKRIAAQDAEDQRIAEWDQEFESMQENGHSRRHKIPAATTNSQAHPNNLIQPSAGYLLVSKSSGKTKGYFPTLANWLRRRGRGASDN